MLEKLCVFCASSTQIDPVYFEAAKDMADVCVDNNIHVLYGGGGVGLMGALADRILERKGKITGIIPDFMKQLEWAHTDVTEMIVVEDMRERKKRMIENVDAVVALPGGIGTLEELMEVITLKQLGRFSKPIIIVNTLGFYDSLVRFLFEMIDKKFMREEHCKIWDVIESPSQLIRAVNDACKRDLSSGLLS
ncbi:MAG TPA: TIGR00730 family Rossman fold protein [Bacteroidales bacterium]|nr:TIGR00730 family Rossman fold protein [Bacteroidales bacterium]